MGRAGKKWLIRLVLALAVAAGLGWLARLDYARKVSTDILELIPPAERAPELALARTLAGAQQAKVALFVLRDGGAQQEAATAAFAAALAADPAFAEVVRLPDPVGREALGRHVFVHRFDLLLPGWLGARAREHAARAPEQPWPEWLAERAAADLEHFLAAPEAVAFQDLVPADPLLLVPGLVERIRGLESAEPAPGDLGLVWARTSAAPLSEAGQEPVLAAVARAEGEARRLAPAVELQWTSIGRFAGENRRRIQQELSWLNTISLLAVLGVAVLCLRQLWEAVHLAPVVLGALLGAWVATTLAFDRVHVLVFVVGSLLGGVAIDYGFYLYLQPPLTSDESYGAKVRRLLKPLLVSAFTTVLGFSLLFASELPLIRQLSVFVSAGLVAALATALLWFGQLDATHARTRDFARARLPAGRRGVRLGARVVLAGAAVVALVGPWTLHWRDDIRELEALPAGMREEAVAVRAQFGETPGRTIYLTRGDSPAAARVALESFLAWHAGAFPGAEAASIGMALPTPPDAEALGARRDELAGFAPALRAALGRHGFEADAFEPFFTAWSEWLARPLPAYATMVRDLTQALRGPLALTMAAGGDGNWFLTVAAHPPGAEPPSTLGTVALDQLQTLNGLFARYRISALRLSALGLGLLGLSVIVLYRLPRGAAIFGVPAGSCLFALGALGLAGQTLNLFHLLGAFLGVCLSHNYAIFSAENEARGEEPPPSIRLSALTTGASFGVLAFSRIAVVAALGTTVALIVLTALAAVELIPLARAGGGAAPRKDQS
ncbi:hypothetical protein [Opitutus sp. ER46]|uniref:hypothetical protein n=1 Tax=Opitutus sp. ER46 TaxID=2161864 RepID=UPI000D30D1C2|nr:hypothetical protein [Opitutus sp. ER46]PTY00688.1 hypothetical protein DB354_01120 [Opitutus sp. ER46]